MKKHFYLLSLFVAAIFGTGCGQAGESVSLAEQIRRDTLMNQVEQMAKNLVSTGFNAGDSYAEVWIRDYNSFIELSMDVMPDSAVRNNLDMFFYFQGANGDIVDGFVEGPEGVDIGWEGGYNYRLSPLAPNHAAHKNTVETDHETSLIQAIYKYVKKSGNTDYLRTEIDGKTVIDRMEWALEFLMNEKLNAKYGLLTGATTADWGDVQPEHIWGVEIDANTHYSIDIYDNAMFVIALNNFIELSDDPAKVERWSGVREMIHANVRKHLWDSEQGKFIPHIYLNGSPFPADFDENKIYYHGGTAMAVLAGLLTPEEVADANRKMLENQKKAHAQTIGLTMYPTYPGGYFKNVDMYPYGYQNGGDWTWFGARMIHGLIRYGLVQEAYDEVRPMFQRIVDNQGFYEWYTPAGEPMGSGTFRGEAGVLYTAIVMLREWAGNPEN